MRLLVVLAALLLVPMLAWAEPTGKCIVTLVDSGTPGEPYILVESAGVVGGSNVPVTVEVIKTFSPSTDYAAAGYAQAMYLHTDVYGKFRGAVMALGGDGDYRVDYVVVQPGPVCWADAGWDCAEFTIE